MLLSMNKIQIFLSFHPLSFLWRDSGPSEDEPSSKAISPKKRLLNICVLLEWNFTDIDFSRWSECLSVIHTLSFYHQQQQPENISKTAVNRRWRGEQFLWYNGNFSRDFYGSDFAFLRFHCYCWCSSHPYSQQLSFAVCFGIYFSWISISSFSRVGESTKKIGSSTNSNYAQCYLWSTEIQFKFFPLRFSQPSTTSRKIHPSHQHQFDFAFFRLPTSDIHSIPKNHN